MTDKEEKTTEEEYPVPEEGKLIFANGFEDAFIGLSRRYGMEHPVATYDYDKCIEILMDPEVNEAISYEGAVEYFEYNVIGAWVGELTPMFLHRHALEELLEEEEGEEEHE